MSVYFWFLFLSSVIPAVQKHKEKPDGRTAQSKTEIGRLHTPGVFDIHVGVVPDSPGQHAQALLPGENVPGVRHGGRVHGAHVEGLPGGVRPGHPGLAQQDDVADDVAARRLPGAGCLPRPTGGGHVPSGLPVEARGRTRADRNAGDQNQQSTAAAEHTARPRGPSFLVVFPQAHHGREYINPFMLGVTSMINKGQTMKPSKTAFYKKHRHSRSFHYKLIIARKI